MIRFISIAVLAGLISLPVSAQTINPDRLGELSAEQAAEAAREAELRKTRDAVRADISGLKKNLTQLARDAAKLENTGRDIERRLIALETTQTGLKANLLGDRETLTRLLAALQRVESNPPPALAISPGDAANAARAGQLMSNISAQLQSRADALGAQLFELDAVKADIDTEKQDLAANETALETKRGTIKSTVSQKSILEKSISEDQVRAQARVAALASEADTLRDLIQQFERAARDVVPRLKPKPGETGKPVPDRPQLRSGGSAPSKPLRLPRGAPKFADVKGKLTAPVTGRISKTYSSARKGVTVTTAQKAQIVAPAAARIEFAGPFKNYENVVILNAGDGYFILLTGLGENYVGAGEIVTPGEPLGLMPFNGNKTPELYIEFRKNGTTINPMPWLGTAFAGR